MHRYEVGIPYVQGRTNWPEQVSYTFRNGAHQMLMFLNDPTAQEIDAVRKKPIKFGLLAKNGIIFFLYRLDGESQWSDAPYSWHLEHAGVPDATLPAPLEENEMALLTITLVDARSGIIRGIRVLSLSIEMSRALHAAIIDQAKQPFDEPAYDVALDRIYRRWSSDRLADMATAKYTSGESS